MDSSRQQEELAVAVYNKDPQERWRDFTVYKLLLRGKFTCVIACVYQWYTARSMVYIILYSTAQRQRNFTRESHACHSRVARVSHTCHLRVARVSHASEVPFARECSGRYT